jgi:hypothetical protein
VTTATEERTMHATPGLLPTLLGSLPVPPPRAARNRRRRIPWAAIGRARHADLRLPRVEPGVGRAPTARS